jgi:hypothetical protein
VAPRAFLCVVVVLTACVDGTGAGPYAMATDPGSRYGFRYVRDPGSGLWVHRECEARVSTKRPPMATMVPDVWSDWTSAPRQRAGAFGWWEEVHGSTPEPPQPLAFPFEVRCRLLLKDHLYVD